MIPVSLAVTLAARELRGGLGHFRIFIACLALGVAAIAGVGSVSEAMRSGIVRDARLLLGGDVSITVLHRPMEQRDRDRLGEFGEVSEVTSLRAMARPASGDGHSLIELKAVDGLYPLYGSLVLTDGMALSDALAAREGVHGAVADPALLLRLGLAVGDRVLVGTGEFEIRGEIESEPDRTIRFTALGPRLMISTAGLGQTGLVTVGSLVDFLYRVRVRGEAGPAVGTLRREFADSGFEIRDTTGAAPGFRTFIDRASLFLTLVGLTALLVGGVGVANAVRALIERRTGTIAILKCLGAPGRLIFAIYLVQSLVLATVGIVLGGLVGLVVPPAVSMMISGLFPVALPAGFYWEPVAVAAVFGYGTTLAFAAWPLGKTRAIRAAHLFRASIAPPGGWPGTGALLITAGASAGLAALALLTSPDRGLTLWFIAGAVGVLVVFGGGGLLLVRLLRRLPHLRNPEMRMAMANLHRPGSPAPALILSLGLGLTVLVTVGLVHFNLLHQLGTRIPDEAPSYFFLDIQPHQADRFIEVVSSVPGVTRFERTPMVQGRIVRVAGVPADQVEPDEEVAWALRGERGLTYRAAEPAGVQITAGDWWPETYAGPPLMSFDAAVARGLGVGLGDSITVNLFGREITATIANLRNIEWRSLAMNFVIVYSPGVLERAPHSVIATVYADGVEAEEAVQGAVIDAFPNVSAISVRDALRNATRIIEAVALAVQGTASVTLLAGVLVLAGAVFTGQQRRVHDAVILKVLGATRSRIVVSYLVEHAVLGLLTALVAAVLGSVIGRFVVTELMRAESYVLSMQTILVATLASLACTVGLGLLGLWRVLGVRAAPMLRNE